MTDAGRSYAANERDRCRFRSARAALWHGFDLAVAGDDAPDVFPGAGGHPILPPRLTPRFQRELQRAIRKTIQAIEISWYVRRLCFTVEGAMESGADEVHMPSLCHGSLHPNGAMAIVFGEPRLGAIFCHVHVRYES
jgi:hypothetical protein